MKATGAGLAGVVLLRTLPVFSAWTTNALVGQLLVVTVGALSLLGVLWLMLLVRPLFARSGMLTTESMTRVLNDVIRAQLIAHHRANRSDIQVPEKVRFRDMDPRHVPQCCALKIVTTDVRAGKPLLFDRNTPDALVAEVVAASAAIPVVFSPPRVNGHADTVFADGGLTSNLPVWSFRDEKRQFERQEQVPPVPIFAFTLSRRERSEGPLTPFAYLRDVITTGIFGSQTTIQNFVNDLTVIDLDSPLGTLDFDCDRAAADRAYRAGLDRAGAALGRARGVDALTRAAARSVWEAMNAAVAGRRAAAGRPMPRLRIAVIDPVRRTGTVAEPDAFRVTSGWNMADDADDTLDIDDRSPLAPCAFQRRAPVFGAIRTASPRALVMTKYEHALLPRGLDSAICLPIYATVSASNAGRNPERVMALDSDDSLEAEFADPAFMDLLTRLSVKLARSAIEAVVDASLGKVAA